MHIVGEFDRQPLSCIQSASACLSDLKSLSSFALIRGAVVQNGGLFNRSICVLMGKYAVMGAHVCLRLSSGGVMSRIAAHHEPCLPDKGIYNPH